MEKKLIGTDYFKNFVNLTGMQRWENRILYTKTQADCEENRYVTDLCMVDTDSGRQTALIEGTDLELYKWDTDGTILLTEVMEDEDKKMQEKQIPVTCFYRLNIEDGSRSRLFRVNKNVSDFIKIAENKYFFLCSDNLMEDEYLKRAGGDLEKFAQIKAEEADYFIADEVPYWTNSAGYCNGKRGRVFLYEDGKLTQITPDDLHVTVMGGFEDKYIVYSGVASGGVQKTTGKLYCYDIEKNENIPVDESEEYLYTYLDGISEGKIYACRSDRKLHGEYQDEYIDIIDLADGSYMRKNAFCDYHIYDNVVSDVMYLGNLLNKLTRGDGGTWFLATEEESSKVFFWKDEEELPTAVTKVKGKVIDYEVTEDYIYMIAMRDLGGTELYRQKLGEETEEQLSFHNTDLEKEYSYSPVERLNFINSVGTEIQGWYLKPVNFEEGKKYPAVLFIHGGPQSAFGEVFNHDMQLMASRGYGVIFCNPTGSEGRGAEFADIRKKYGTIDSDDLIGFTKHAVKTLGWIDEKKLGITGGSYGGIMTNWIIGHSDLFSAAVSDRGVCNNISDFGLSDIGVSFGHDTFETTPWDDIQYLWDTSPLKYVPDIKTPVLLIHGVEDYRCPYDSALQMHTALTYFGTPSKVVAFKGENHELCRSGQPKHRIRRLAEAAQWFDKYLK